MRDYKELKIWDYAHKFVKEIYILTNDFPEKENYGVISQIRRAAVSIPTNIVEGCGRSSKLDFIKFLDYSMGSLYEVEYLLLLSFELNYIESEEYKTNNGRAVELIKMLSSYIKYLKTNEPKNLKS